MPERSSPVQEIVLSGGTTRELLRQGHIRQVRLQTREGQTLVGARVAIDLAGSVPGILRAPAWAAASATALAAKFVGLEIVVERGD